MVLFLFDNVIYVFLLLWLCILIACLCMTTATEVFPRFSSVVSKIPGENPQRRGTARTLPTLCVDLCIVCVLFYVFCVLFYVLFVCCSMYFVCWSMYFLCVVLCILCVDLCIVCVLFYVFCVVIYVFFVCCSMYFVCCSMYWLFCDVLCIICVYMDLLPPGDYHVAIKYVISYHIIYHKSPPLVPVLSHMTLDHVPPSCFLNILYYTHILQINN
jgi:hypothetical protein